MGNIVLLDELTINKIAAGEVIERPASVIKEMVENSIDAGGKNITIEIKNGGISLIRITDDGCGISEDDMEIAFERHATSKIRRAEDLETVKSMGFRGEALASIAAISNIEMISRTEDSEIGHKIIVEGGKILEKSEVGCPVGTTITVQNLFFNTPVRYKFLKKDYTEAGYIEDIVTRIALINKDISIKFINSNKQIIQTNGNGDFKAVIYNIYGKDIANGIVEVSYQYEDMKVIGVIGKPEIARGNRTNQIFFVNGRYVRDKNLSAAVEQAYKGMITIGKYGFVILNIEMDPKKVDVNVHPAKLEVRFEEENKVFKAIYHSIKSGLKKVELVENVQKTAEYEKQLENSNIQNEELNKNKKAFSNLFKKAIKEDEEIEEGKSNYLESIYNFRKGLKEIGINSEPVALASNILNATVSNEEMSKKIKLGNTIISSETKELDAAEVNEKLKERTHELLTTKIIQNSQKTQVMDLDIEENKNYDTQGINVNAQLAKQNGEIQEVICVGEKETQILPQNTFEINENKNLEKTEDEINNFNVLAEKFLKEKMELENTQIIDTNKVREALEEKLESNPEFEKMYKKTFGVEPVSLRKEKEAMDSEKQKINASNEFLYAETVNMNVFEDKEEYEEVKYKFIGIVFSTYIIIEIKNEMYIIDQHAAHERIMYEKVKSNYYSEESRQEQFLLLPDIITLTHKEMDIAKENIDMFAKAGFTFEEFGDNTIKLISVPYMCENLNTKQLFLEVLDEIDTVAVTAKQEKEEKFIATIACKSAVKAKMKLDEKEVDSLMKDLLKLQNPFTCPHGRPTAIKMSNIDMEKKFSRR